MWNELRGEVNYQAGSAPATVTIPKGAALLQVVASATSTAGSLTIFGGNSIVIPTAIETRLRFNHLLFVAGSNGSTSTLVFGGGASMYYVEYVLLGAVWGR